MREYKTLSFKMGNNDGLEPDCFQGYGAAFGNCDGVGDIIERGAFAATLADFLAAGVIAWQHDWTEPIGKPLDAYEDQTGLFIKARLSQTARGKDALTLLRDGVIGKMSIGYTVEGYKILSDEEGCALLGETGYEAALRTVPWWQDGVRVLTAIKLYEISLVTVPANPAAVVTGVKEGLLAGLTLDDHFQTVLATERGYLTRVKDLSALRAKSGRVLSAANRERLEAMKTSLVEHTATLDDLIVAATPPTSDTDSDGKGRNADGADGADGGGKDAPDAAALTKDIAETPQTPPTATTDTTDTTDESERADRAALAALARKEFARYHLTLARLNGVQ